MLGQVVGSYQIVRELGVGGMGIVYLAQHVVIGRLAAIKLLRPELSVNAEMVARIFNEARMTALIKHPGLVDVYDFGRLPDGRAYLVMEYLEGETLASMIARQRRLPVELAVGIARQIAAAVGAAHQKGIVHRDLKPDNVFIVADEEAALGLRARILDFGIAKLAPELTGGGLHTRTGSLLGTPTYMAPEQCRGTGKVDSRADIYALGCILFEMVTGRRLFDYEGMGEILAAHLHTAPDRPSSVERSVPAWLDAVILKALAKSPGDRYGSMDQLAAALGARAKATTPPIVAREPSTPPVVTTFSRTAGEMVPPPSASRRAWVWMLAGAVVLAGGAGALLALRTQDEPKPVAAPPAPTPVVTPDGAPVTVTVTVADAATATATPTATVTVPDAAPSPAERAVPPPPKKKATPPPPKKRKDTMDPFQ
jgi:eukaryotic-like serine/threonine-protein kinase